MLEKQRMAYGVCGFAAMLVVGATACGGDDTYTPPGALYQAVVETKQVEVGGGTPQRLLFGANQRIELDIPGDVAPARVGISVSLVTGTVKRGQHPVNDAGLLVQPQGLQFAMPVRVRQPVPPPAPGRTYVSVVIPDNGTEFVARTAGRRVSGPEEALGGLEIWEGEGDSSGLWGFAEVAAAIDVSPEVRGSDTAIEATGK